MSGTKSGSGQLASGAECWSCAAAVEAEAESTEAWPADRSLVASQSADFGWPFGPITHIYDQQEEGCCLALFDHFGRTRWSSGLKVGNSGFHKRTARRCGFLCVRTELTQSTIDGSINLKNVSVARPALETYEELKILMDAFCLITQSGPAPSFSCPRYPWFGMGLSCCYQCS